MLVEYKQKVLNSQKRFTNRLKFFSKFFLQFVDKY